jgi:hypothetical protein
MVLVQDSTYILGASTGRFNRTSASVIKLDQYGDVLENHVYKDSNRSEDLGFSGSKLFEDNTGNYWLNYTSRNKSGWQWYPKILKFDQGLTSFESKEFDTLALQYFQTVDKSRLIVQEQNDRYFITAGYNYLDNLDTANNLPWDSGTFLLCFSISTDSLLFAKRYNYSTTLFTKPRRFVVNYLPYSSNKHLLILQEDFDNNNFSNQYCKVLFYTIDPTDGHVISTKTLQDSPWSNPGFGAAFINNEKDLLLSYSESTVESTSTGQPYHAVRPTVARLDSNFNVVWKKVLRENYSTTLGCGNCIEKFVINQDSTFVAAHVARVFLTADSSHLNYPIRVTKRSQNTGISIWNRDYYYYSIINNTPVANYTIHDAEATPDGGYIFVGESTNFDSLNANAPGQLGYVIKTNCLGFLRAPEVGFSHQNNDSLGVSFTNTSLMAGSYNWNFGDSTTLQTGEGIDSIFHQYNSAGDYEVSLIGFGCNGENDTIRYTITVPEYTPEPTDTVITINPNIVNYMALGPNPVKSGESIAVYVGNLPSTNAKISFYNYEGKLLLERPIPQSKSTYIISLPFSAGVYQAVLRDGGETLEVEKILVY